MPEHEGGEAELPETMFTNLPQSEPIECLVRVYIISVSTSAEAIHREEQNGGCTFYPVILCEPKSALLTTTNCLSVTLIHK